jgi:hypothetical protein
MVVNTAKMNARQFLMLGQDPPSSLKSFGESEL